MWYAVLFGSRAERRHHSKDDFDVVFTRVEPEFGAIPVAENNQEFLRLLDEMKPLSKEYGGELDVFWHEGYRFLGAFDEARKLLLDAYSIRYILRTGIVLRREKLLCLNL